MSFAQRFAEVRTGFERPFWVANISEIFERLSYYAVFAVLVRYLNEALGFPLEQATSLGGLFGGAVWVLAAFGGAVADWMGYRRALSLAYFILSCAYFLVGSIAAPWLAPVRNVMPLGLMAGIILLLPALGVALVKPSVVGTTARASKDDVRTLGYAIYYTMVNIGSTLGPIFAGWAHKHLRPENVFRIAALSVFLMLLGVLVFFREPRRSAAEAAPRVGQVARNLVMVLGNARFVLFLLIFSGYWIVFWQQYLILPSYIVKYIDPGANTSYILSTDPLMVICFTVAVNAMTRRFPSFAAVTVGTLVTAVGWIFIALRPSVVMAVISLAVVALGEIIQSPRYYEYISRVAPPGQQGTYLGFAFLPIGIGSLIAGPLSGRMLTYFADVHHAPQYFWYATSSIGIATALLLFIYDRLISPSLPPLKEPAKAA